MARLHQKTCTIIREVSRFGIQHRKQPFVTLYSDIALGIAGDPAVLELAQNAAKAAIPQLFLAAVHFLLYAEWTTRCAYFSRT